jgi:hypothetical protein
MYKDGRARMKIEKQPFWKDEPEVALRRFSSNQAKYPYFAYITTAVRVVILIMVAILLYKSPVIMLAWLILFGLPLVIRIIFFRSARTYVQSTKDIQGLAREKTGASSIGSAIHVAGYPLLQRDQQVVLAIVGDQLNIYNYEDPTPLDSVSLKNIQAIYTVSYDDDRVPHIDAIDSVAQALQLTFLWQEQPCTCLFRRMRTMKPVDWFHAIQQTRLQLGLVKNSSS